MKKIAIFLVSVLAAGGAAAQTIPQLPAATTPLSGTEQVAIYQSGATKQTTLSNVSLLGVTSFSADTTGLTPSTPTTGAVVLGGTLGATNGGTAQNTYATGDMLYASAANTLSKLTVGAPGDVLSVSTGVPAWTALSSLGVTSFSGGTTGLTPSTATTGAITLGGTLGTANGGTNCSLASGLCLDNITGFSGTGFISRTGAGAYSFTGSSGTGNVCLTTNCVMVTPNLGTPSAVTLTNATGLPLTTGVTGTLGTTNGGTGLTTFTAANNALYSTSASALTAGTLPVAAGGTGATTSTGSGAVVLATSPTLTTPNIGAASGTSLSLSGTSTASQDFVTTALGSGIAGIDGSNAVGLAIGASSSGLLMSGGGYALAIIADSLTTGATAVWLLANNTATLVSANSSLWQASTTTPTGAGYSVASSGGNYRIYTGTTGTTFNSIILKVK